MAEGGAPFEPAKDESEDTIKRKMKVPSRKKFNEDVEAVVAIIKSKEEELKLLKQRPQMVSISADQDGGEGDTLHAQLKVAKADKEAAIEKRKELDNQLRVINAEIAKKVDVVRKLQAGLKFKTEARIDEAIRKFEQQLRTHNFKMSEEKRIVSEIDTLRRSKKSLGEYLDKQKEIDTERVKQKEIKDNRDHYFRTVTRLKSQEDAVRQQITRLRTKEDQAWTRYKESGHLRENLKKEIDDLYEKRRKLYTDFKRQQTEFTEIQKQEKQEMARKREEEKRLAIEAQMRELEEYEASREPYEDEKLLIVKLNAYLHRHLNFDETASQSAGDNVSEEVGLSQSREVQDLKGEFRILRKKSADDFDSMFGGVAAGKRKKSSKKQRRQTWTSKPLKHSPQIFEQFEQLGISAPTTVGDIVTTIQHLADLKEYYEKCPPKPQRPLSKVDEEQLQRQSSALQSTDNIEYGQFDDAFEPESNTDNVETNSGSTAQESGATQLQVAESCQSDVDQTHLDESSENLDATEDCTNDTTDTAAGDVCDTCDNKSMNHITQDIEHLGINDTTKNETEQYDQNEDENNHNEQPKTSQKEEETKETVDMTTQNNLQDGGWEEVYTEKEESTRQHIIGSNDIIPKNPFGVNEKCPGLHDLQANRNPELVLKESI